MSCSLYVMEHEDREGPASKMFKVGISTDVGSRLRSIQTSCPYKLTVALQCVFESKEIARAVEARCHALLADVRVNGEWFEVDAEYGLLAIADAIVQLKTEGVPNIEIRPEHSFVFDWALSPEGDAVRQRRGLE